MTGSLQGLAEKKLQVHSYAAKDKVEFEEYIFSHSISFDNLANFSRLGLNFDAILQKFL